MARHSIDLDEGVDNKGVPEMAEWEKPGGKLFLSLPSPTPSSLTIIVDESQWRRRNRICFLWHSTKGRSKFLPSGIIFSPSFTVLTVVHVARLERIINTSPSSLMDGSLWPQLIGYSSSQPKQLALNYSSRMDIGSMSATSTRCGRVTL
jgi:hypothetical protein